MLIISSTKKCLKILRKKELTDKKKSVDTLNYRTQR